MRIHGWCYLGLALLSLPCANAVAGISLDSSRLVFSASDMGNGLSIGVSSSAQSSTPYLVKAQVLRDVRGHQTDTPFSVTPSLFRLEPGSTNQLRILKTGNQALAKDKESLFYLRVIALPAGQGSELSPKTEVGGALTVSTGSVIKLFYRPMGLSRTQQQAMAGLQFTQQGNTLHVANPSPYYVTLTSLTVGGKAVAVSARQQNTMIAPFSQMTYPSPGTAGNVSWQAISDFGGTEKFNGKLQ
ncbi:fimbrial biogenesis chaperone [Serratia fonticola]|uniref:fimbrial biogenesis chaperone n=1 Tax=Serratia fonticola TaxID=47917 RepID=UPI0021789737|nr:molecular chaperone [Serratia fonticola]CAI1241728.1 Chaperone protein fimC precursor [Serratia fonticola]